MTFKELSIIEPVLKALLEKGYEIPTPIQEKAIPPVLNHRDILGLAQTGTGKTAAFAIPIIQHLHQEKNPRKGIKALILTPTRELAIQISECIHDYAKYTAIRHTVIFGGVKQQAQTNALRKGGGHFSRYSGTSVGLDDPGIYSIRYHPTFCFGRG